MAIFNLETLDSLIEYNTKFATELYKKDKTISTLIVGYPPDNSKRLCFMGEFKNAKEKSIFVEMVKLHFLAYNIDKYVIMCEAWCIETNDKKEHTKYPSLQQHPNKIESLMILANNKIGQKIKMFKITAEKDLEFWRDYDGILEGTFSDLLPKEKLQEEKRKLLFDALKKFGQQEEMIN